MFDWEVNFVDLIFYVFVWINYFLRLILNIMILGKIEKKKLCIWKIELLIIDGCLICYV